MSGSDTWVSVGALAEAFVPGSHAPLVTPALEGQTLALFLEDGTAYEYRFLPGGRLEWKVRQGSIQGKSSVETVAVYSVREGIYLIDYLRSEDPTVSVTTVADLEQRAATVVVGRLPGPGAVGSLAERATAGLELTPVAVEFLSAAIGTPLTAETIRHFPTLDLIGRRVEYTYSPTERYEHIYLNERFYTRHCLEGVEKGLADTDRCHYFKVAADLYLFVWREKIIPTLGLVLIDLRAMRTAGKIFGYQGSEREGDLRPVNFAVGAKARLLNVTTYAGEGAG